MQKRLLESRGQYLKLHLDVAVYLPPVLLLLILRVGGVKGIKPSLYTKEVDIYTALTNRRGSSNTKL